MNNTVSIVPEPILINRLKHHLGYVRNFVEDHMAATPEEIGFKLLCLGESQMDMYIGKMSVEEIAHEIIYQLQAASRFEKELFVDFLHEKQTGYATLQASDGTTWYCG
jgi:hypothetical protein